MFVPIDREEVLKIIKQHGPLLPLEVKRHLGKGDTTIVGATLSELAHHGKVKISNVKRGSSPFYYDPNNPASLEKVAKDLGEKDYRTFQLLKEKKVIRVDQVDPLTRVGLGIIKDYSIQLKVQHQGQEIIFYQYYLVSDEEAHKIIKELLTGKKAEEIEKEIESNNKNDSLVTSAPLTEAQSKSEENKENTLLPDTTKVHKVPKIKKIIQKKIEKPVQKRLTDSKENINQIATDDDFLKRLQRYCNKKNIIIIEYDILRKNSDIDLVITVPTALGKVDYYCKAKSKKKSNDGDVASALLIAQQKRLPCVYLTTGEVTKKAKELTKSQLKGVLIKEIP